MLHLGAAVSKDSEDEYEAEEEEYSEGSWDTLIIYPH